MDHKALTGSTVDYPRQDDDAPGLKLTASQASRFLDLDPAATRIMLDTLVDVRSIRLAPDGSYLFLFAAYGSKVDTDEVSGGRT